jgi:hypothetical protein
MWLILLAPWAGLAVWLLSGQRNKTVVPFLALWRANERDIRKPRRAWEKPPLALVALLIGMLLAIFAAAGPGIRLPSSSDLRQENDVTIDLLSVESHGGTQAMVRLVNRSDWNEATLTAEADGKVVQTQRVQLPGRGQSRNYFLDIPGTPSVVDVNLDADGLAGIQHRAEALRRSAWPIVEARSALPPEVRRMIEVYARRRPAGEGSPPIAVALASDGLDLDLPAAYLADGSSAGRSISKIDPLVVQEGPLTQSVDWASVLPGARVSPMPQGTWQPIVSAAGDIVAAKRDEPFRQVWVGFDSPAFASRADFVIFWSNIFNWLGNGGPTYDWNRPSQAAAPKIVPVAHSISSFVLLGAMGLIGLAAGTWRKLPAAETAFS